MWQAQVEIVIPPGQWAIHANQVCGASPHGVQVWALVVVNTGSYTYVIIPVWALVVACTNYTH